MLVQFSKEKYYFSDVLSDPKAITYATPLRVATEFYEEAKRDQESFLKYIWALKHYVPHLYWLMILGSKNCLAPIPKIVQNGIHIIDEYDISNINDYVRRPVLEQIYDAMTKTFSDNVDNWLQIEDFFDKICKTTQKNEFELMKLVLHQSLQYGEIFVKYANYIKENNLVIYQDHYKYLKELSLPKTIEIASEFLDDSELFFDWLEYANGEEVILLSTECDAYYDWNGFAYSITDANKVIKTNLRGNHFLIKDGNEIIATLSLNLQPKVFVVSMKFINKLPIKKLSDWRAIKNNGEVVLIVRTDEVVGIKEDI